MQSRWQYGVPPFTSRHPGRPLRYKHILYLENVNTYQICCVEQLLDSPDSFSTMLMSLSVLRSFMHCHSFEFHLFRCEFAAVGIFFSPSPPVAVIAVCGNCKPVLITCINICSVKHLMYNLCNVSGCPTLVCVAGIHWQATVKGDDVGFLSRLACCLSATLEDVLCGSV